MMNSQSFVASPWKNLFKIGGVAAFLVTALALVEVAIEASGGIGLTSTPTTVIEWFTLLQTNPMLGLAVLGIFETAFFPLGVVMFIALYFALRRASESLMVIATALYSVGTTVYFASNNAFAMLNLSNQYAIATTESQQAILLAAGQAVIATEQGTGMMMTFFLGSLAGLIVSAVMLRSKEFGKPIGIIGIVANALGLLGPASGAAVWTLNGLLMMVWTVMVGIKLLKIGRVQTKAQILGGEKLEK